MTACNQEGKTSFITNSMNGAPDIQKLMARSFLNPDFWRYKLTTVVSNMIRSAETDVDSKNTLRSDSSGANTNKMIVA